MNKNVSAVPISTGELRSLAIAVVTAVQRFHDAVPALSTTHEPARRHHLAIYEVRALLTALTAFQIPPPKTQ